MDKKKFSSLVLEQGRKDTKEYYHKDRKGWIYNIWSAILIAIITPIIYGIMGLIVLNQFLLLILAGIISGFVFFLMWRAGVFLYYFLRAPRKLYEEKEAELEKYNWDKIVFSIMSYTVFDISGYALRIENKKSIDIRVRAEIKQMRVNQKICLESDKGRSLKYIDRGKGIIEEKISECYFGTPLVEHGKSIDLVLTRTIQEIPYPIFEFNTYPDKDIPWPFEPNVFVRPIVVLECEIQGGTHMGDEAWALPKKTKYIQIMVDGKGIIL